MRVYGPAGVDLFLVLLECLWKCLIERGYSEQQLGEDTGGVVETHLCGVIQTQDAVCVLLMRKHDGVCTSADDISRPLWGTKRAEKVIWEIMWRGSQSRDSGSKVMGFISPIVRVLISFVISGKLINLLLPHFSICKMERRIAPTSEDGWEDSKN